MDEWLLNCTNRRTYYGNADNCKRKIFTFNGGAMMKAKDIMESCVGNENGVIDQVN